MSLDGTLLGQAAGGTGGSLSLVTGRVTDLGAFGRKMAAGGFNESLAVEATTDSINLSAGDTIQARSIKIVADDGSIDISGTLDASRSGQGGTVEVYAKQGLTVDGNIDVRGLGSERLRRRRGSWSGYGSADTEQYGLI